DELLDVGVIDVEHHHLGSASSSTTGLDSARGRIRTTHERDRAGSSAAGGKRFFRGANPREVQSRSGTALENQSFFLVPVQDRLHRVVDRQDETRRDLLL